MAIELETLYEKVSEYDIHLVAGKKGMKNIAAWFQMIESIQGVDLIEENSILFTSGLGLSKEDDLEALIRLQSQSKACATVLIIGEYIKTLPQVIIEYCNNNQYPLFIINQEKELSNIMRVMSYEILRSEKASLELSAALKDAISFPTKTELYVPVFRSYGFQDDNTYCMVMIEAGNRETNLNKRTMVKLIKSIEKIQMSYGDKSFIINSEGIFLLLFSNYTTDNIVYILEKILAVLNQIYPFGFYISVGRNTKNITSISESHKYAQKINTFLKNQNIKNTIYEFDKLGMYKILMSIDNTEVADEYIRELLAAVIDYDTKNKSNLYEVLKLYLENDGSIKAISEILFLHRNSINYKIKKIEELLNCDLSSMKMRTKLYVAFLLEYIR
ncbi:helix-turn-helix domain-containing protein [Anaerotignum sp.]|uniref:helix-turn-helix domain-containing protein n=1 Tax=Anaerotignum sp. TaxID=2039241 RepID=UPI0028A58645|nr:helix-turn-helix domain-containing protein [Anaerotignum sp.]